MKEMNSLREMHERNACENARGFESLLMFLLYRIVRHAVKSPAAV